MGKEAAEALLRKIAVRYADILKGNLAGIYVHGSLAFGCFCFERSDIDFIVVTKRKIPLPLKCRLVQTLLDLTREAPAKGFEMSAVLSSFCNPFVYPTPFEIHYSDAYRDAARENLQAYCRKMHGTDKDLAAHFTVIHKTGYALTGAPIEEVFREVPRRAYLDSILRDIDGAEREILKDPVYFLLNMCRVAAYVEEGLVLSKKRGGEWETEKFPACASLFRMALKSYRGEECAPFDERELKACASFLLGRIGEGKKNLRSLGSYKNTKR